MVLVYILEQYLFRRKIFHDWSANKENFFEKQNLICWGLENIFKSRKKKILNSLIILLIKCGFIWSGSLQSLKRGVKYMRQCAEPKSMAKLLREYGVSIFYLLIWKSKLSFVSLCRISIYIYSHWILVSKSLWGSLWYKWNCAKYNLMLKFWKAYYLRSKKRNFSIK